MAESPIVSASDVEYLSVTGGVNEKKKTTVVLTLRVNPENTWRETVFMLTPQQARRLRDDLIIAFNEDINLQKFEGTPQQFCDYQTVKVMNVEKRRRKPKF